MLKLFFILLLGLVFESTGVVLLKKGIVEVGQIRHLSAPEIGRVFKASLTNWRLLLGVLFEACFFVSLLILMARSDISFLWPLTGLSFVFATLAAMWFLHEQVSPVRWAGVLLIMVGAALISYSEHAKPISAPVGAVAQLNAP